MSVFDGFSDAMRSVIPPNDRLEFSFHELRNLIFLLDLFIDGWIIVDDNCDCPDDEICKIIRDKLLSHMWH